MLHTSDWHLGRSFGHVSLHDDQQQFVDWFVQFAVSERVEVVLLAGDVYDRSVPPPHSIELFRSALTRLQGAGIAVVDIAGNHDGPERVAAYDGLLDASGVHIRGGYQRAGDVIRLSFADGPLAVVPVPYLDPVMAPDEHGVPYEVAASGIRLRRPTHHAVVASAIDRALRQGIGPRSIAVAHGFVTGGGGVPTESESERQLTVGGHGRIDASVFRPFSYTALGHLHAPQVVGADHVRYSGAPLAYSFSETKAKQVVLVELSALGIVEVMPVTVPVGRGVVTVTGTLEHLLRSASPAHLQHFVRAVLTDAGPVLDAKPALQRVYPYVVEVQWNPARSASASPAVGDAGNRTRMQPLDAAIAYWADVYQTEPDAATSDLLRRGLAEAGVT